MGSIRIGFMPASQEMIRLCNIIHQAHALWVHEVYPTPGGVAMRKSRQEYVIDGVRVVDSTWKQEKANSLKDTRRKTGRKFEVNNKATNKTS